MNNRYGITKKTEHAALPHGTVQKDILSLPEIVELMDQSNDALRTFIASICEVDKNDIALNPEICDYMFKEIQKILSKSNPGLKIVRPNVSKNVYYKRMQ